MKNNVKSYLSHPEEFTVKEKKLALMLISDDLFMSLVVLMRGFLKIPESGFSIFQNPDITLDSDIPDENPDVKAIHQLLEPKNVIVVSIKMITSIYDLPENWDISIFIFLISNKMRAPSSPVEISIEQSHLSELPILRGNKNGQKVVIRISENMSFNDLKYRLSKDKQLTILLKQLPKLGRGVDLQRVQNVEPKSAMLSLKNSNSLTSIARELPGMFQELSFSTDNPSTVSKYINRYKEDLGKLSDKNSLMYKLYLAKVEGNWTEFERVKSIIQQKNSMSNLISG